MIIARKTSISTLAAQIPRLIYANNDGMSFGELFAKTCNGSPASASIYQETIHELLANKVFDIVGVNGEKRRSAIQIKTSDQIMPAAQRPLFGI